MREPVGMNMVKQVPNNYLLSQPGKTKPRKETYAETEY